MLANCQIFSLIAMWLATIIHGHCLALSGCGRYVAGASYLHYQNDLLHAYSYSYIVIHCTVIMVPIYICTRGSYGYMDASIIFMLNWELVVSSLEILKKSCNIANTKKNYSYQSL